MITKPYIAVPLGDPAGIGPEIAVKAALDQEVLAVCNPVLVGTVEVVSRALQYCALEATVETKEIYSSQLEESTIRLMPLEGPSLAHITMGKVQAICGQAAYDFIKRSVEMAQTGEVSAVATTTINKESLLKAGVEHIGHTEILAHLAQQSTGHTYRPLTLFETEKLRITFLTRHLSLKQAIEAITEQSVYEGIIQSINGLKSLGIKQPHLAVAGLNPHCGEHGRFGEEEGLYIEPAIRKAQAEGHRVTGPIGADSVFYMARRGDFDGVLSLYHDQGHIAAKTYDFDRTISLTLGLPFLRTSVDHGTAFDIAGKGIARHLSMVTALKAAARYCNS